MNFNDDYKLVYREDVYPDCIKFHGMNGVMATVTIHLAKVVEDGLKQEGYRVRS